MFLDGKSPNKDIDDLVNYDGEVKNLTIMKTLTALDADDRKSTMTLTGLDKHPKSKLLALLSE